MKRILSAIVFGAVVAALVGCGPSATEKKAQAEASASATAAKKTAKAKAADAVKQKACESAVGDFKKEIEALNSKLSVGMSQGDFNDALGDVKVVYDQIDIDSLANDEYCLDKVAKPLEDAFNNYVKSNNTWNKCITDYACKVEGKVLSKMQGRWSKAQLQITVADVVLKAYAPSKDAK